MLTSQPSRKSVSPPDETKNTQWTYLPHLNTAQDTYIPTKYRPSLNLASIDPSNAHVTVHHCEIAVGEQQIAKKYR